MNTENNNGWPEDLSKRLLELGEVTWGAVAAKPDSEHVSDFVDTLRLTREHFGTEGNQPLNGVYIKGTDIVICHTGTSPNSAAHARIIVGLMNKALADLRDSAAHDQ